MLIERRKINVNAKPTPSTNNNVPESTEEAANHTVGNPLLDNDEFFDCTEDLNGIIEGDRIDNYAIIFPFPTAPTTMLRKRNAYRPHGS
ncbi:MAG: hypothetical protein ACR5K2_00520 [Wolbachia sp.]